MKYKEITCPKCNAKESGKTSKGEEVLLIRAFKHYENNHWYSRCLVCSGQYPDYPKLDKFINKPVSEVWF